MRENEMKVAFQGEPGAYGSMTLNEINARLAEQGHELGVEVTCRQSNHEGELIDALQDACLWAKGVVFNPGGFTHTSVALSDAVAAIGISEVEVHMSNVYQREEYRHRSMLSTVCIGKIVGFGWQSYLLGLRALVGEE
jgi:3-dehydroquinate dehydratase-2